MNRHGTNGTSCSAQLVSIGAEVMIGSGAFIYPGVKLRKDSTVEAGAVVKSHLPDTFTQLAAVGQQRGPDGGWRVVLVGIVRLVRHVSSGPGGAIGVKFEGIWNESPTILGMNGS